MLAMEKKRKEKKNYAGSKTLPASNKEKESGCLQWWQWLRRGLAFSQVVWGFHCRWFVRVDYDGCYGGWWPSARLFGGSVAGWSWPATDTELQTKPSVRVALMVTMGGDLQPGCLADRLLTGLGQPQIYLYWLQWGVTFSQIVWLIGCWLVSASHE